MGTGNRERVSNLFKTDAEENVILWSWIHHPKYHARYEETMADPSNAHLEWVQITSPHRQREWLAGLE